MKNLMFAIVLSFVLGATAVFGNSAATAVDISGTWKFSVDLDTGGHGDPTFVFKQDKETLTGSYDGPLGQQTVSGMIKGDKAEFGFEFTNDDQKHKITYKANVESATKMTGTVEITDGPTGKWTATKQ